MFHKVLIANRGEIAVRVIRACRELGLATVAVFSEADRECLHVKLADESVCIGPPAARESYLDIHRVLSAAVVTGADAIHPGYGFLAENSTFAEICEQCKIKFVGPSKGVIDLMGHKARARERMRQAGVPIIPGSGLITTEPDARKAARSLGLPLIIKAAAGGGGKGMRIVRSDDDLARAVSMARAEAEAAFGNGDVYMERYLEEPRHVEIQILADEHGNLVHLGERDCSVQTARHQKLLEESPCIALSPGLRNKLGDSAVRGAKAAGYTNAGTMEFLLGKNNDYYFMEMNTRIQVEHPVTELVTGIDLVKEQLRIAMGERLSLRQRDLTPNGHAMELRITAEDPKRKFAPSAGKIDRLMLPGGPGVRVDTHIYAGYSVPPYYDSLLAKLLVHGRDRVEAIARAERALDEFQIDGVKTTVPFHRELLKNEYFRKGEVFTNFLMLRMGDSM